MQIQKQTQMNIIFAHTLPLHLRTIQLLQVQKQMFMQILNVQSTVSDRSENLLLHGGTPSVTLTQML